MEGNRIFKYILMCLLSLSNNLVTIFIHGYVILFIQNSEQFSIQSSSLLIALLLSSYDIFRIAFSYFWDILKRTVGTHIPITISLFLLSVTHMLFSQAIISSMLNVVIIRSVIGIFNPLSMYLTLSFCEMFSSKEQKTIGNISNLIKNLTGALLLLTTAFLQLKHYHIITFSIGVIHLLTAILYIMQFKCQVKMNNLYEFQENEVEISKNQNFSQTSSLYHGNPKLRNPNNELNLNNSNNPKRNKSIDSSTNKNFKQFLNSESIDNNLEQINKISGKESNDNGKISTLVNGSIDKKLFNGPAHTQIQRKFNLQINNNRLNNTNSNSKPSIIAPQPGEFNTNQTNQMTPKGIKPKVGGTMKQLIPFEHKKVNSIPFIIILSLIQVNFYFSFFGFLLKMSFSIKSIGEEPKASSLNSCLLISLYYFSFILFIPLNNCIMKYFISSNDKSKRIKAYHTISIISLIFTISYYSFNYCFKQEANILFAFLRLFFLIIKNESTFILTSCVNILILHLKNFHLQEMYSKHQKKLCVLITYSIIALLLFIDCYFVEYAVIGLVFSYLIPTMLLLAAYIMGIVNLFKQR